MTNIETSSGLTRFYRGWRFFLKKTRNNSTYAWKQRRHERSLDPNMKYKTWRTSKRQGWKRRWDPTCPATPNNLRRKKNTTWFILLSNSDPRPSQQSGKFVFLPNKHEAGTEWQTDSTSSENEWTHPSILGGLKPETEESSMKNWTDLILSFKRPFQRLFQVRHLNVPVCPISWIKSEKWTASPIIFWRNKNQHKNYSTAEVSIHPEPFDLRPRIVDICFLFRKQRKKKDASQSDSSFNDAFDVQKRATDLVSVLYAFTGSSVGNH